MIECVIYSIMILNLIIDEKYSVYITVFNKRWTNKLQFYKFFFYRFSITQYNYRRRLNVLPEFL